MRRNSQMFNLRSRPTMCDAEKIVSHKHHRIGDWQSVCSSIMKRTALHQMICRYVFPFEQDFRINCAQRRYTQPQCAPISPKYLYFIFIIRAFLCAYKTAENFVRTIKRNSLSIWLRVGHSTSTAQEGMNMFFLLCRSNSVVLITIICILNWVGATHYS